jgi:hypothetical protein
VTIGAKSLEKGAIELRSRRDSKTEEIPLREAAQKIHKIVMDAIGA